MIKPLRALAKVPVDIGNLVVSGTKITMQQPRIAGFTSDRRQYELTAQAAARDLLKPDVVELQGLHATMEMQDKVTFEDDREQRPLRHQDRAADARDERSWSRRRPAIEARLAEAVVDIRGGKIVSDKPVEVKIVRMAGQVEPDGGHRFRRCRSGSIAVCR